VSDVGSLKKASATEVGDLLRDRDTVPVAFTQTDLAAKGVVRLPSGATVEMHGGPGFRLRGPILCRATTKPGLPARGRSPKGTPNERAKARRFNCF